VPIKAAHVAHSE